MYIIVIYRQPCALHISWSVHHPSGEEVHLIRGIIVFQGVNIPPYWVAT